MEWDMHPMHQGVSLEVLLLDAFLKVIDTIASKDVYLSPSPGGLKIRCNYG